MVEPPSPPYIPAKYQGGYQATIKRLVLHGTVSGTYCGGAKSIAEYFQNPTYVSSAHYVVDTCETYQCVYDNTIAWHDGTNDNSIGVEMCDPVEGSLSRWDDEEHQRMLSRTADLVRQLCLAYDVPMRWITPAQIRAGEKGICTHDDMSEAYPENSSHWDPGAWPADQFMALVTEEDDMPLSDADISRIWHYMIHNHQLNREEWAQTSLGALQDRVVRQQILPLRAEVAGLAAAVAALSSDSGLTAERVEQIVRDAVEQNINITGTVNVSASEE